MGKIKSYFLFTSAILILLTLASCHLPGRTVETTSTQLAEETGVPGEGAGSATESTSPPVGPSNTDGAETILVPAGSFWMGSEQDDVLASDVEKPFHLVTLEAFHLYTHEVTNAMYSACEAARACVPVNMMEAGPTRHYDDPAFAEFPVVGVDWNMADDYCTWASGRLPTEAEWEYAARGLDSLVYPWGAEDPACDRLNMFGCEVPPDTVQVGSYLLGNSSFDVWDMAGNAWEWVHDWYAEGYYGLSPQSNPLGPSWYLDPENPLKVVRGGGLYSESIAVRSAKRASADPLRAFDDVGFRCVAEGELLLPSGYAPVPEGHEFVPADPLDGDGETLEEPDGLPWYSLGDSLASCPGPDGRMHLFIEADSSELVEYSVVVNGNPFDCTYDPVLRGLQCEGPIPADNDTLDFYTVDVTFDPGAHGHLYPTRPLDCPDVPVAWLGISFADCPVDRWVAVHFLSAPPITWYTIQLDGADVMCWPLGAGEARCSVPERLPGDNYSFHLLGHDAEDRDVTWDTMVGVPADCPVQLIFNEDVTPLCFEGHQTVQVMYEPVTEVLSSITADGVPLSCIGMAPGVQICGEIPGDPGSPTLVTTCFEGLDCMDWPLTVAFCPPTGTIPGSIIEPTCYPPGSPGVSVHYWPFDEPIAEANANGAPLACDDMGGGFYLCSGLPGAPGDLKTITFCPPDFACFGGDVIVPACAEEEVDWRLASVGCYDETHLFFIVDTGFAWLVPGAGWTYHAWDGSSTYSCSVHPTIPGRLYCIGPRPPAPGPLDVYVQQDGTPPTTSVLFEGWPGYVAAVPSCAPEEPPPPSCADYHTPTDCGGHGCYWNKITSTCSSTP